MHTKQILKKTTKVLIWIFSVLVASGILNTIFDFQFKKYIGGQEKPENLRILILDQFENQSWNAIGSDYQRIYLLNESIEPIIEAKISFSLSGLKSHQIHYQISKDLDLQLNDESISDNLVTLSIDYILGKSNNKSYYIDFVYNGKAIDEDDIHFKAKNCNQFESNSLNNFLLKND